MKTIRHVTIARVKHGKTHCWQMVASYQRETGEHGTLTNVFPRAVSTYAEALTESSTRLAKFVADEQQGRPKRISKGVRAERGFSNLEADDFGPAYYGPAGKTVYEED